MGVDTQPVGTGLAKPEFRYPYDPEMAANAGRDPALSRVLRGGSFDIASVRALRGPLPGRPRQRGRSTVFG